MKKYKIISRFHHDYKEMMKKDNFKLLGTFTTFTVNQIFRITLERTAFVTYTNMYNIKVNNSLN